jgi:hypothetical protein
MTSIRRFSSYFRIFAKFCLLLFGLGLGLVLGALNALVYSRFGASTEGLFFGLSLGFLFGGLFALGLAFALSYSAARRGPLDNPFAITGLHTRRTIEIKVPCNETWEQSVAVVTSIYPNGPNALSDVERRAVYETRPSWRSWGTEIQLWMECFNANMARIHVICRPVVPFQLVDWGTSQQLADLLANALASGRRDEASAKGVDKEKRNDPSAYTKT